MTEKFSFTNPNVPLFGPEYQKIKAAANEAMDKLREHMKNDPTKKKDSAKLDTILAECDALSKRFDSAVSRRRSRSDATGDYKNGDWAGQVKRSKDKHRVSVFNSKNEGMDWSVFEGEEEAIRQMKRQVDDFAKKSSRSDANPEHTVKIAYSGDFNMAGLIQHMHRLGSVGASRTIKAVDENDKEVPFGWDGDGADKIHSAEIDGVDVLSSRKDADDREWRIYVGSKSEGEAMTVRNFSGPESKKTENELRAKAYFEKERLAGKKVGMAAGYFTLPGALKLYIYKTSPF